MNRGVKVIGLGCELDRLFSDQDPATPLAAPLQRDDLRELFDVIAALLRTGDSIVVIVGKWLPANALDRVMIVHSLLETDRVAIHLTELPPLAASVLAALAAALAPFAVSAGALAGSLDAIGDELVVLAWAGSVAGLRHPGVSLWQHARSALPWTTFGIGLQPESFVRAVSRGSDPLPLAVPAAPIELLVAPGEQAQLEWMLDVVAPALGGVPVREVPGTFHGAEWWGTDRLVEAVGVPTDRKRLARTTIARSVVPCSWCGELIVGASCPFCRAAGQAGHVAPPAQEGPAATLARGGEHGAWGAGGEHGA